MLFYFGNRSIVSGASVRGDSSELVEVEDQGYVACANLNENDWTLVLGTI